MTSVFPQVTVHDAGEDIEATVCARSDALARGPGLTPPGRHDLRCRIDDAQPAVSIDGKGPPHR